MSLVSSGQTAGRRGWSCYGPCWSSKPRLWRDTLFRWSKLPRGALWGQVASSWGAQFELILSALGRADEALTQARAFFDAAGPAFDARPKLYVVEHCDLERVHQCRASCCLYYKVKGASCCASCPLITQEERVSNRLSANPSSR
jgi:hypothetical protein